jgi:hypothetical protein
MVPLHIHKPLAAIVVMKQRRIRLGCIHKLRVGPFPINRVTGRDIVRRILERAVKAPDVRIDQPEPPICI